jgi:hypothetical protein
MEISYENEREERETCERRSQFTGLIFPRSFLESDTEKN